MKQLRLAFQIVLVVLMVDLIFIRAQKPQGANWAVLVAGSSGYFNYRHQADISHAYNIVKQQGIPESNIITFMFDDIAYNKENPFPGQLFNQYNGSNVYPGRQAIDYREFDVTPENFLKVLMGQNMDGIGSGKTLKSGKNDKVFIYFSDHGASYLLAFPGFKVLNAKDLMDTLRYMYKYEMYNQLVFYVEACESGSMFNEILSDKLNIYAETASTPYESSYACDYSDSVSAYLNDCYSINWMNNTDHSDLRKETIGNQYETVKKVTTTSKVCTYGDYSIEKEPLINFQGNQNGKDVRKLVLLQSQTNPMVERKPIDSRLVYEDYIKRKIQKSKDAFERYHYISQLDIFQQKKLQTDHIFQTLSDSLNLQFIRQSREKMRDDDKCHGKEGVDLLCVKKLVQLYEKHCGHFDEYSIKYASYFRDACLASSVSPQVVDQHLKLMCKSVQ